MQKKIELCKKQKLNQRKEYMTVKKTSVIGFPRIGKNRELKFASEKFFKGEISEEELKKTAAALRLYGWEKQKKAGISFIPSNDFSFYDNLLDTAFLLSVIPDREWQSPPRNPSKKFPSVTSAQQKRSSAP